MKLFSKSGLTGLLLAGTIAATAPAGAAVIVGGQEMFPTMTIVENAVNSADHTTLVAAVQAAGLVDVLNTDGPFTVFAPVNAAFDALPAGTVESLLQPENLETLSTVLKYHVVPGEFTFVRLKRMVQENGGSVDVQTAAGATLTVQLNGPNNLIITDAAGGVANITIYDVIQSNGVIHSIDRVLLPN